MAGSLAWEHQDEPGDYRRSLYKVRLSFTDCTSKQNGVLSTKENTAFRFNLQVQAKTT
jgi:hypothetical protein